MQKDTNLYTQLSLYKYPQDDKVKIKDSAYYSKIDQEDILLDEVAKGWFTIASINKMVSRGIDTFKIKTQNDKARRIDISIDFEQSKNSGTIGAYDTTKDRILIFRFRT